MRFGIKTKKKLTEEEMEIMTFEEELKNEIIDSLDEDEWDYLDGESIFHLSLEKRIHFQLFLMIYQKIVSDMLMV